MSKRVEIGEAKRIAEYLLHLEGKPIEQAEMIKDLLDRGWTQERIAKAIGWSQSQISTRLKLLDLHPALKERARKGEIRPSVAWELANMPLAEQERYIERKRILLKEVEQHRRELAITQEVMSVLNISLPGEADMTERIVCPKCGHEFTL